MFNVVIGFQGESPNLHIARDESSQRLGTIPSGFWLVGSNVYTGVGE